MLTQNAAEILEAIEGSATKEELIDFILIRARRLGLDHVAVNGSYNPGVPTEADILHAGMPDPWTEHYLDQGFLEFDPVLKASKTTSVPFLWRDVTGRGDLSREEALVMREAEEIDLRGGLLVPIHAAGGYSGFVSFAGEVDRLSPGDIADMHVASIYLHEKLKDHVRNGGRFTPMKAAFTPREKECLRWIAMGKSDWEIGTILSISEHTVKQHANRIKQKLGVRTRVQAVVEAIRRAVIFP